jgi:crotonobetainyl-CoA:carnitine CoA-transferase CaiB-like acyl-CoA transferase
MERLGLGFETLQVLNPQLSMVSPSDFEDSGSYRYYELTELVSFALAEPVPSIHGTNGIPLKR